MELLLYKLKFPGNMGAIYRLSYNFHVTKIWEIDCVKPDAQNTQKVERHIPIEKRNDLGFLANNGKWNIALEQCENPMSLDEIHHTVSTDRILLAVGNEAYGIPEDELKKFDGIVSLKAQKPQSYNVSHALSIALYKIFYG